MVSAKMLLSPISLSRKANIIGIGGTLGGAIVSTIVLEFVVQMIEKVNIASVNQIGSTQLPQVPFINQSFTARDLPSLAPAIAGVMAVVKGRTKFGVSMIIGSLVAKVGLKNFRLNPKGLANFKQEPEEETRQVYF